MVLTHNNKTMTPEEQLINDILVLEERKAHCPEWQEHEKLEQRQLKAVTEYASTKVGEVAFKAWFAGMQQGVIFDHNDRKEMWEGEAKRMTFDEWYTKYKLSQI